ncbi:MAG: hypothetical protein IJ558_10810 [Treponema sp.]|nr:hypothetical protein [Treponema sp.]
MLLNISFVFIFISIGLALFERVLGLKQKDTIYYKVLYIFYKVSFFIFFCSLYIFVFLVFSQMIILACTNNLNEDLRNYLCIASILCLNIRGGNLIYFIVKISIYDRFKQHETWIKKSKEIIIRLYRLVVYFFAFIILLAANILSFIDINLTLPAFMENVYILNIAFTTVLGFDVMCEEFIKAIAYLKSLFPKKIN